MKVTGITDAQKAYEAAIGNLKLDDKSQMEKYINTMKILGLDDDSKKVK